MSVSYGATSETTNVAVCTGWETRRVEWLHPQNVHVHKTEIQAHLGVRVGRSTVQPLTLEPVRHAQKRLRSVLAFKALIDPRVATPTTSEDTIHATGHQLCSKDFYNSRTLSALTCLIVYRIEKTCRVTYITTHRHKTKLDRAIYPLESGLISQGGRVLWKARELFYRVLKRQSEQFRPVMSHMISATCHLDSFLHHASSLLSVSHPHVQPG